MSQKLGQLLLIKEMQFIRYIVKRYTFLFSTHYGRKCSEHLFSTLEPLWKSAIHQTQLSPTSENDSYIVKRYAFLFFIMVTSVYIFIFRRLKYMFWVCVFSCAASCCSFMMGKGMCFCVFVFFSSVFLFLGGVVVLWWARECSRWQSDTLIMWLIMEYAYTNTTT